MKSHVSKLSNNSTISTNSFMTNKKNLSQNKNKSSEKNPTPFKTLTAKEVTKNKKLKNFNGKENVCENSCIQKVSKIIEKCYYFNRTNLDLANLNITDQVISSVRKKFSKLKKIKTIILNNNQITENGLKILLKSLKEVSVENLFVLNNRMRETALDYLISYRKYNKSLKAAYLGENPIKKTSKMKMKLKLLEQKKILVTF